MQPAIVRRVRVTVTTVTVTVTVVQPAIRRLYMSMYMLFKWIQVSTMYFTPAGAGPPAVGRAGCGAMALRAMLHQRQRRPRARP